MENLREILESVGYTLFDFGREYRARPLYRDSNNNTVLRISKKTGWFTDYKLGVSGPLEELVKLTLGFKTPEEAKEFLKGKLIFSQGQKPKPKVKTTKTFSANMLNELKDDPSYWLDRGISKDTLDLFGGGVAKEGRMKYRYVFPIFNSRAKLIGLSGRCILKDSGKRPKWKHMGGKSDWKYPFQANLEIVKDKKEVILIESIGDMLSLWDQDVKNTLVTFGLDISIPVLNSLIKLDPEKITIALNNDDEKNSAGNIAAEKLNNKLKKYFDFHQVKICLPSKGDFGEMTGKEIVEWEQKCNA
jgi:hypothetical protein